MLGCCDSLTISSAGHVHVGVARHVVHAHRDRRGVGHLEVVVGEAGGVHLGLVVAGGDDDGHVGAQGGHLPGEGDGAVGGLAAGAGQKELASRDVLAGGLQEGQLLRVAQEGELAVGAQHHVAGQGIPVPLRQVTARAFRSSSPAASKGVGMGGKMPAMETVLETMNATLQRCDRCSQRCAREHVKSEGSVAQGVPFVKPKASPDVADVRAPGVRQTRPKAFGSSRARQSPRFASADCHRALGRVHARASVWSAARSAACGPDDHEAPQRRSWRWRTSLRPRAPPAMPTPPSPRQPCRHSHRDAPW